jgi:hypothetical protein
MKKIVTNLRNEHAEAAKRSQKEADMQRILDVNQRHSFYEVASPFIGIGRYFLLPLAILYSVVTEMGFFGTEFYNQFQSAFWAVISTAFFILLIEGGKIFAGVNLFRFLTHGWISRGWHYVGFFLVILIMGLIAYGGSIFTSISAGPIIADNISRYQGDKALNLVSLDSINNHYESMITPLLLRQEEAHKTTWHGSITRDAMKLSNKIQDEIDQVRTSKREAISKAEATNSQIRTTNSADVSDWGLWLQRFAGIGEGLQILIYLMICVYERGTFVEIVSSHRVDDEEYEVETYEDEEEEDFHYSSGHSATDTHYQPADKAAATMRSRKEITPFGLRRDASDLSIKPAGHRLSAHEQTKDDPQDKVQIHGGIPVALHVKPDGQEKWVNEGYCKNMVDKYTQRVQESMDKLQSIEKQDTKDPRVQNAMKKAKSALQNRLANLKYWKNLLSEIKRIA